MGIGKDKCRGESTEDDISELNAAWGDDVAESEVILAEEFGEVVEKD